MPIDRFCSGVCGNSGTKSAPCKLSSIFLERCCKFNRLESCRSRLTSRPGLTCFEPQGWTRPPWIGGMPSLSGGHRRPTTGSSLRWEYPKMRCSLYGDGQRKHREKKGPLQTSSTDRPGDRLRIRSDVRRARTCARDCSRSLSPLSPFSLIFGHGQSPADG